MSVLRSELMLLLGIILLNSQGAIAKPLRKLSCQFAVRAAKSPVIDGKLDDECWEEALSYSSYITKEKNPQRTVLKIVWDDKGIYFGIVNYEKNIKQLKAATKLRDGGDIWRDDSAELYIDPTTTGYTMFKFDINSIGAINDWWQVDVGFLDKQWSAVSAKAVCSKRTDAWIIEFFVSWNDLKKKAKAGDVWFLIHRRLTWAGGHLEDYSTSGGNFWNRKFGYLCFIDKQLPTSGEIAAKLRKYCAPEWILSYKNSWIWAQTKNRIVVCGESDIIKSFKKDAKHAIDKLNALKQDSAIAKLKQRFNYAKQLSGFAAIQEYNKINQEAQKSGVQTQLLDLLAD